MAEELKLNYQMESRYASISLWRLAEQMIGEMNGWQLNYCGQPLPAAVSWGACAGHVPCAVQPMPRRPIICLHC